MCMGTDAIQNAKDFGVVELFIAHPPRYPDQYTFFAVHNVVTNEEGVFHEVCVPDMLNTIGTGETLEEAHEAAAVRLTCEISDMKARGDLIPKASSYQYVHDCGIEQVADPIAIEFNAHFCGVVVVNTLPGYKVPELSEAEIAHIDQLARQLYSRSPP